MISDSNVDVAKSLQESIATIYRNAMTSFVRIAPEALAKFAHCLYLESLSSFVYDRIVPIPSSKLSEAKLLPGDSINTVFDNGLGFMVAMIFARSRFRLSEFTCTSLPFHLGCVLPSDILIPSATATVAVLECLRCKSSELCSDIKLELLNVRGTIERPAFPLRIVGASAVHKQAVLHGE